MSENEKLKKIIEYDLKVGNEIRSALTRKDVSLDKGSIYSRSDIYNISLPQEILERVKHNSNLPNGKIILGSSKYLSKFESSQTGLSENLSVICISDAEKYILSSYSRQYLYYLLLNMGFDVIPKIETVNQTSQYLDFLYKRDLQYYSKRELMTHEEVEKLEQNYLSDVCVWFGEDDYSAKIVNSGTAANWCAISAFVEDMKYIYYNNAFYFENVHQLKTRYADKIVEKYEDANLLMIGISPTNYFEIDIPTVFDLENLVNFLELTHQKKIIILDITSDPSFRLNISNKIHDIIYTFSLTKMCGNITNYFAGVILFSTKFEEKITKTIFDLDFSLDPIAKRFFSYPDMSIAQSRFNRISRYSMKLSKEVTFNQKSWWSEFLTVNLILHPPIEFMDMIERSVSIFGNDTSIHLRYFYHSILKNINSELLTNFQNEIVIGDSFGMGYMRMNMQGRDFEINSVNVNIRFPRISFGYEIRYSKQKEILIGILSWLQKNWKKLYKEAFELETSVAKLSEM